jgi:hypothetical protein
MRKFTVLFAVALAVFAGTAYANFCARDVVPAATLLVPYAVTSTADADPTTLFSITNVSADATIVHVTLWDMESTPEIDFDVILSGYDTWQINFRDVMRGDFTKFDTYHGTHASAKLLPDTPFPWGPDGLDWTATTPVPVAWLPDPQDRNAITQCGTDPPPYGDLTALSGTIVGKFTDVMKAHAHDSCNDRTLRSDLSSWTTSLTSPPIVFYATADVVNDCSILFPSNSSYWTAAPGTYGAYRNVLIGDVIYFDPTNNYSEMMSAAHVEANTAWTGETFYGRYFATTGIGPDLREPLATAFAFRYVDEAPTFASDVIVWKNVSELTGTAGSAHTTHLVNDCGRYIYYAWDHNEHSLSRTAQGGPSGFDFRDADPNQFPFETQKVALVATQFDLYANLGAASNNVGWMLLVFPPSYGSLTYDTPLTEDPLVQAWVGTTFKYNIGGNKFSAGAEAATMANANCFTSQILPALGVNYNYSLQTGPVE